MTKCQTAKKQQKKTTTTQI